MNDGSGHSTTFGYDPDGELVSTTMPNGTATTAMYDRAGRALTVQTATTGVTPLTLASFTYTRGNTGLVTSFTPTGVPQAAETYTYTALDQLASVNGNSYLYDPSDNMIAMRGTTTQAFDNANQVANATTVGAGAGSTAFTYDVRGNRTASVPGLGTATQLGYDQANRLTSVTGPVAASYTYDGDDLRASKTVGATTVRMTWDTASSTPLLLADDANQYVYGPGGLPVEHVTAGGQVYYYAHDALGSTRLLTNGSGTVVGAFGYDAHGSMTSTGAASTPLGFAGEYRDAETGFTYLRARYYDPRTGQFLTRDPAETVTAQPYQYGHGDPVNRIDPLGLIDWNPVHWVQSGASAVGGWVSSGVSAVGSYVYNNASTLSTIAGALSTVAYATCAITEGFGVRGRAPAVGRLHRAVGGQRVPRLLRRRGWLRGRRVVVRDQPGGDRGLRALPDEVGRRRQWPAERVRGRHLPPAPGRVARLDEQRNRDAVERRWELRHPEVLEDRGARLLGMDMRKRAGRTTGLSIYLAAFALGAMTFVLIGLLKADIGMVVIATPCLVLFGWAAWGLSPRGLRRHQPGRPGWSERFFERLGIEYFLDPARPHKRSGTDGPSR